MADKLALINAAKKFLRKKKLNSFEVLLDPHAVVPHLSSGNPLIDYIIGGSVCPGFARGQITEVAGGESSGKSTFMIQVAAAAVQSQMSVLYLDYEHSLSGRYAARLGLDVQSPYFSMYQPATFEDGYWFIKAFMAAKVDLIIVDSLAAMVPKAVIDATDMDKDTRLGLHANLTTLLCKRGTAWMHANKSPTAWLFVNQLRADINTSGYGGGGGTKTTGGRALRHYAACRLLLKPTKVEKHIWTDPSTGIKKRIPSQTKVKLENIKNKVTDRQGFSDQVILRFGRGFDPVSTAIDIAIRNRVILKNGGWYTMLSKAGDEVFKVQGKDAIHTFFDENPDQRNSMLEDVRQMLIEADLQFMEAKGGLDVIEVDAHDDEFADDEDDVKMPKDPFGDDEYDEDEDDDA